MNSFKSEGNTIKRRRLTIAEFAEILERVVVTPKRVEVRTLFQLNGEQ